MDDALPASSVVNHLRESLILFKASLCIATYIDEKYVDCKFPTTHSYVAIEMIVLRKLNTYLEFEKNKRSTLIKQTQGKIWHASHFFYISIGQHVEIKRIRKA